MTRSKETYTRAELQSIIKLIFEAVSKAHVDSLSDHMDHASYHLGRLEGLTEASRLITALYWSGQLDKEPV